MKTVNKSSNEVKYRAIDLFSGIGGLRLGFEKAFMSDIEFVFSSEIYNRAIQVYEENFGETPEGDITSIPPDKIPDHDILMGGWPCQSFSIAGRQKGFDDPRGNLFFAISNILKAKKPYAFLLENVPRLEGHDKGKTFETIMHILKDDLEYTVYYKVLNARNFGVPQNRPRIFIVGFKEPIEFKFPQPTKTEPKLLQILEKEVPTKYYISKKYLNGLKGHRLRHESKKNGFGYIVLNPEGVANALVIGGMGLERNLIKTPKSPKKYEEIQRIKGRIPNREGIRKLTPLECKRLMGFPESFKITIQDASAYRVLAESVVVPVITKIAKNIRVALEKKESMGLTKWT